MFMMLLDAVLYSKDSTYLCYCLRREVLLCGVRRCDKKSVSVILTYCSRNPTLMESYLIAIYGLTGKEIMTISIVYCLDLSGAYHELS